MAGIMAQQKKIHPRIEAGEIIPDVRRREIHTYSVMVDDAMELLPITGTLDLSSEDDRDRLRRWALVFVQQVATSVEWAYRRATDSALEQANELMRDPKRYARQRTSRKVRKEMYQAERERAEREREDRIREQRESIESLIADGKVTPMHGRAVWNLPCCTGKPDELSPKFCHRCHHEHVESVDGPCGHCPCGEG